MRPSTRFAAATLPLFVSAVSALAAQEKPTRFTADLGFVNASGNTSVTSFNLGEQVTHTSGTWKLQQTFAALYGKTDGEKSADQFKLGARADAAVSERLAVYGLASWDRNQFAGTHRRFEEGVGLAFKALTGPRNELDVEAGFGATQQVNTEALRDSFLTGRAASRFKHLFREKTFVEQRVEFIPNFDTAEDYRLMSETSLVAPLSAALAFKTTFLIRYDNLPEPGFEKSDRVLTTGIQINW